MSEGIEYPALPDEVLSTRTNMNISSIKSAMERGQLIINEEYQREAVQRSKPDFRTRLIESVLMNFPIPPITILKTPSGQPDEILDGQQRVTTVLDFMKIDGSFSIKGEALMKLDYDIFSKKKFKDLPEEYQWRIENYKIGVDEVRETDDYPAEDIYTIMNTNRIDMKHEELMKSRYCREDAYQLLAEYSESEPWLSSVAAKRNSRGKATGLAFKALMSIDYGNALPSGSQGKCLEWYMERVLRGDNPTPGNVLRAKLQSTLRLLKSVFGDTPSMKIDYVIPSNTKLYSINFYILFYCIRRAKTEYSSQIIESNAGAIREGFYAFVNNHRYDYLENRALSGKAISKRNLHCWDNFFHPLLELLTEDEPTRDERRIFTPTQRDVIIGKALEDEGGIFCHYCKNEIMSVGSVEIDHIKPWSEGGKTVIENGAVIHSSCNKERHHARGEEE